MVDSCPYCSLLPCPKCGEQPELLEYKTTKTLTDPLRTIKMGMKLKDVSCGRSWGVVLSVDEGPCVIRARQLLVEAWNQEYRLGE
jgi:hypothetical protein